MAVRVLMVDPEEALLEAYLEYLTTHGFRVETASSGPEALSKLESWQPDVLVLEPDMPDDWGEKIVNHLRKQPDQPCVPVVVLTRRDPSAITYPVRQHHVKPISMSELTNSINRAAQARQPEPPPSQNNGSPHSKEKVAPSRMDDCARN